MTRTGARIVVDQLVRHGVDIAFCVPGESYLGILDALYDAPIRLVVCRHEAGAAHMAEAYGKLTGRPGVVLVTRAPGAAHASVGLHVAYSDSTPLVLLVGQVPTTDLGREAFQELDSSRQFGEMAKTVLRPLSPARLPEAIAHAFSMAASGRPGPVVVELPGDVQAADVDVADAEPYLAIRPSPAPEALGAAWQLLGAAERPLVIAGGGAWSPQAAADLKALAEASRLPVAVSFRRQDYFDNRSPSYVGHLSAFGAGPTLPERVRDADVLLAVGSRLGSIATRNYTLVETPRPRQKLIHVHPDPRELGRVYSPALAVLSGSPEFLAAARALDPLESSRWAAWTEAANADYQEQLSHGPSPGELDLGAVNVHLRERLPEDAIVTSGAGNFAVWSHRFHQFSRYRSQLAPSSGTMGYGVPAAIAAKLVHPDRTVICFSGDGDFLMSGHELATAVLEDTPIVVLVVNNNMYGSIREEQERHFPGRVSGTALVNPNFADYARAFGAHGAIVERTDEFAAAFEAALAAGRPAVLELRIDPEAILPDTTLTAIGAGMDAS